MLTNIRRLLRYAGQRAVGLVLALVVAIFLTILIANAGGYMDNIRRAEIRFYIGQAVMMDPANRMLPPDQLNKLISDLVDQEIRRLGLDTPFVERAVKYLGRAMSLQLGFADLMLSDAGSRQVRLIIVERLPSTLLLFGTAQLVLFFVSLFVALFLSRRYGSFADRFTVALAPTSAAPGWFYGIFLILIFAFALPRLGLPGFPDGRMVASPAPEEMWRYALSVLRHMVLPITAIVLGSLFGAIYSWRTFFLIYSTEDYVELARAKGLRSRTLERRYIMRPTLPPIITSLLLLVIAMWMGQIVLEHVFNWPGIGQIYFRATQLADTPVIVGVIVVYGYLLALTVFMLDFIYAALDPRVRVGAGAQQMRGR